MLKNSICFIAALTFSLPTPALETDNYITWNRELEDSADAINTHITEQITRALEISNNKRKIQSCQDVTFRIGKRFKPLSPVYHPIENWIKKELNEHQVYPRKKRWAKDSIYRIPFRFYLKNMPLAPNVQIGGVYLGTDKLTHFTSTGRRYLKRYLKALKKGMNELEAQKRMIRFGLHTEATYSGLWSAGVFSYGDMEANYQGFLFYKKLCMEGENSYLKQLADGKWTLAKAPDLRDYVNPYWDETFNLSYRLPKNWSHTSKIIKEFYCPQQLINLGGLRMDYYQKSKSFNTFSLEYIKELQDQGYHQAPKPHEDQSFHELCHTELSPEA